MPGLERVQQRTPATLSQQWYESGVAADPAVVTIGITRADGTVLVGPSTATAGAGASPRTFNLTTTHTALLDRLTVTWTSSTKGTLVSYVEVAGGFLFTIADALLDSEIDDDATDIAAARTMAEQAFEQECGVAFVPRYERERITSTRRWHPDVQLGWQEVRTIRDATVDGVALSAGQLDTIIPRGSLAYYPTGWWRGVASEIYVGYEHGYDNPPAEVSRAVLRLAKHYLSDWSSDDRALRLDTDAGSYVMAVPGRGGSVFGIPEVDSVAARYRVTAPFA